MRLSVGTDYAKVRLVCGFVEPWRLDGALNSPTTQAPIRLLCYKRALPESESQTRRIRVQYYTTITG